MAASLEARKAYAAARWGLLADRLRTVTPETVARVAISLAAIGGAVWLAAASWPALAPFVAGVVIAYAVLPIANRLDRVMPRALAALLAELAALAVLGGVALLIVPPFIHSLVIVAGMLPTADRITAIVDQLQGSLGELQEPIRGIVLAVTSQVVANLAAFLDGVVSGAAGFVTAQILGVAGTLSFVLGLLVIPAWILTMVSDDRAIRRRAVGLVTPGLRPDVVALARIVDRALGTFLRVQVTLAIATGLLVWLGLEGATTVGVAEFKYAVAGATLLGLLQLFPEVGFFLGLVPILLVLAVSGPVPALVVLAVYWAAARLAGMLVEPRVSRGVLDVHAALLIPGIVVLSQFGLLWTLAAAPLIAIARDLIRYTAGRLEDPPRPAGVLPGDRRTARAATPVSVPIPSAYLAAAARRGGGIAPGRASTAAGPAPAAPVPAPPDPLPAPAFTPSFLATDPVTPPALERSLTP